MAPQNENRLQFQNLMVKTKHPSLPEKQQKKAIQRYMAFRIFPHPNKKLSFHKLQIIPQSIHNTINQFREGLCLLFFSNLEMAYKFSKFALRYFFLQYTSLQDESVHIYKNQ